MDMDLKTLRNEIRNLSELVDGWNAPDEVPGIERDLVLEKLRNLYDSLRFALPASSRNTTEVPVPESIDLDVAFSIEPLAVVEPEFAPDAVDLPEPEAQPASAGMPEAEPDPETVTRLAPRSEPAIASQPVAATLPEPTPEADPGLVPEAQPASADTSEAVAGSALDAESDTVNAAASRNSASQPVVPTLFGPEEAVFRHRHKQRIIMSLYGAEPQEPESNHTVQPSPDQPFSERHASAERSNAVQSAVEAPVASERIESATPDSGAEKAVTSSENPIAEELLTAISQAAITDCDVSHPAAEPFAAAELPSAEPSASESASDAAPIAEPFTSENAPTEDQPVAETVPTATEPLAAVLSVTTEQPAADLSAAPDLAEEQPAFEELPVAPVAVLGEVINHDVRTLADTIAPVRDMAATLRRGEPVDDLRSAIGINDKFLLIRDLFGGDGSAYEAAIDALNRFDNLDDCMIHIAENYAWNPHSDGAKFLMELLERKYS